ncbi:unnamed protein product, partial [Ectocarpus fasciculatus]
GKCLGYLETRLDLECVYGGGGEYIGSKCRARRERARASVQCHISCFLSSAPVPLRRSQKMHPGLASKTKCVEFLRYSCVDSYGTPFFRGAGSFAKFNELSYRISCLYCFHYPRGRGFVYHVLAADSRAGCCRTVQVRCVSS